MHINPKFHNLESSYLSTLQPLIQEYNAINVAEGFTGFHCSPGLIALAEKHVREGLNQFSSFEGEWALRKQVSVKLAELYDRIYQPDSEITITAGAAQGIFTTISALVSEGDEVIVFEPANEYYVPAILMNGGQPVFAPMKENEFHIDWEEVQKLISAKTKMILVNTPHSPTGWAMSEIDMLRLQKIINGTKIIILSEETFEHIVFDQEMHQSVALYPKLAERSVIVSSFGETYHVTGWQIGFCAAPKELMREIRKVHQVMMQSVNSPFQLALAEYMTSKEAYQGLSAFYQQRRDFFLSKLEESRFTSLQTKGSFFQLLDYSEISTEPDRTFAVELIKKVGVAVMPISAFFHNKSKKHLIRINFAQPDEVLEEVGRRLSTL